MARNYNALENGAKLISSTYFIKICWMMYRDFIPSCLETVVDHFNYLPEFAKQEPPKITCMSYYLEMTKHYFNTMFRSRCGN